MEATEKVEKDAEKAAKVRVTFVMQNYYVSYWRYYHKLRLAVHDMFGDVVDIKCKEGPYNAGFDVYISRVPGPNRMTESIMTYGHEKRTDRLLFSKLREGFFPAEEELLLAINQSLKGNRMPERSLNKVQCVFIYSSPQHAKLFQRLVSYGTSQLVGQVKFEAKTVPVPDVLEIWLNGHLIYSMWSCSDMPELHDVIYELCKAVEGQPFNTVPKLR